MTPAGRLEALRQRRRWLLAETPASRTQARLGQAYVGCGMYTDCGPCDGGAAPPPHPLRVTSANLTGKDLQGFNLVNTNFTNANLTNVNLTGATLTGAILTGANLTGVIGL